MQQTTPEEAFKMLMADKAMAALFNERPESIQELIKKYPYLVYKIKPGAPYTYTCPGSIVHLETWTENGEIKVTLLPEDKLPQTLKHEQALCEIHNTDSADMNKRAYTTLVNPKWLEPYFEQ